MQSVSPLENIRIVTPRKKFYSILRNRFLNVISSILSKNTFRININLFDFKKSSFWLF